MRIRNGTAQSYITDPSFIKLICYTLEKTGTHNASAAIMDKDLSAAEFLDKVSNLRLRVPAKNNFCGCEILKIEHENILLFYIAGSFNNLMIHAVK